MEIGKFKKFFVLALILIMAISFAFLKIKQVKFRPDNKPNNQGLIASSSDQQVTSTMNAAGVKKFSSYDELKEFLDARVSESSSYSGLKGRGVADMAFSEGVSMNKALSTPSAALGSDESVSNSGSGASTDYSKTNIQVEGVDEADIIKTDGKYIYAVSGRTLFIIEAYPADGAKIVSRIEFKSQPQDIYIKDKRLVVYGNNNYIFENEIFSYFRRRNSYTFFKIFDINDPQNPKQVRDLSFEGSFSDSRLVGNYVYFITNNYNYYPTPDPVVPRVIEGDQVLPNRCAGNLKCYTPAVYYFDRPYDSYSFTSVNAIDITNDNSQINGDIYLLSSAQNIFMSQSNLYITYTKYISEYDLEMDTAREIVEPRLNQADRDRLAKIEATDSSVLSQSEKRAKIQMVIERYLASLSDEEQKKYDQELETKMKQKYSDLSKELEKTVIYKIAVNNGQLEYKATGEVTGSVLNQFSMDENNGYFRIATTKNQTWSRFENANRDSYNNVYVLDENLKTVGSVENLAPTERIYSVRFLGKRAYVVTFKRTDPLIALDLSDPRNPRVTGELKIPGFSNYLHPYGENMLIGFGKDADDDGNTVKTKGLKLSLFDVSDPSSPKELDTYLMGDMGSDSAALYDHKAFLFSAEKNLLVVPVSLRRSTAVNSWGEIYFNGAMVFRVVDNKFDSIGRVAHEIKSQNNQYRIMPIWDGGVYHDPAVKRGLYISDNLYTFSDYMLKISSLSDFKEINKLEFVNVSSTDFQVVR